METGLNAYLILLSLDSACRASTFTSTTIDACSCVNNVLSIAFADSANGAGSCTCSTVYTSIINYMSHFTFPPNTIIKLL